jgi:hypothetical protein
MKIKPTISLMIFVICAFYLLSNAQAAPPEVLKAAQTGLPEYMHVALSSPTQLGFNYGDSLQKVILGEPVEVYTVLPKDKINKNSKCKSLLSNKKEYYFPIILDGQIKSLLTVYNRPSDSVWAAAGIGTHGALVKELSLIRKQWPTKKGYSQYILEFPTIGKVYFTIPQVDEYNMTEINIRNTYKPGTPLTSINSTLSVSDSVNNNSSKYLKLNSMNEILDTLNTHIEYRLKIGSSKGSNQGD